MPSVIITGKEPIKNPETRQMEPGKDFVPRRARYKVYTIPEEHCVRSGIAAGGSIALDLDVGKYRVKVVKHTESGVGNVNWGREFLVGLDEAQWLRLKALKPKWVRVRQTTDGVKWKCTMPGCEEDSLTKQSAVMHEMQDHFGINPLEASDEDLEFGLSPQFTPNLPPSKRGPGRPRKDEASA